MIATGFWGVKARKSQRYQDFAETVPGRVGAVFVRKETVRISPGMLNSPRIKRHAAKSVKLKYECVGPSHFLLVLKSPLD